MHEGFSPSDPEKTLRRQAEDHLRHADPFSLDGKSPEEIQRMFHELQVHQVELEMQQEELQLATHALRVSEARYRHLYQFAPNGYFTVGAQGGIEELNYVAARLLGLDRRVALGKLLRTFITVDSRLAFDDFFSHLQYLNDIHRCEVTLLPYRGEPRILVLEGARLDEEPSVRLSFLITALDVTGLKKAELAARAQTDLLQSVMQAVMIGVVVFDSLRDEAGEVVDFVYRLANPAIEKIAGRSLVGLRYAQLYPSAKSTGVFNRFKKVVDTGESADFEQYYQGEGFAHWFHIMAVRLGDGLVWSVADITGRKRMEEENLQMRLSQQQALLQAILEAQEEERRRISESLHNGVGQLLYATKLNLNQIDLHKTPLPLAHLQQVKQKTDQLLMDAIKETRQVSHELIPLLLEERGLAVAIANFCQRFSHSGLALSCHSLEERLDKHLETAIYRIAQELVNNIVKHSGATKARIEVLREGNWIVIEAQDNGKGIDPDPEPSASQGVQKGIGLRTIEDRVKLLAGKLDIDSAPGKGTLITITLPGQKRR